MGCYSKVLEEKPGMPPGQKLALFVGREIGDSGSFSKGGTLIVMAPESLINKNPEFFIRHPCETKIIIECRLAMYLSQFFEIRIGLVTDFSFPQRETLKYADGRILTTDRGDEVKRVSNLYLSVSQSPFFLQHVLVRGYFTQRFLMTTSASELGEMTAKDFSDAPPRASVLRSWVPKI